MEKKKFEIGFKLVQIKTDQFALFEENFIEGEKVNLTTSINFGLDSETRVLVVVPKFTFEINEKPFITIQIRCYFEIEDKAFNSFIVDKNTIIPKHFICHASMHAVGTARGVLHSKTEGTPFNSFVLPPVNVDDMIPEDVVFE